MALHAGHGDFPRVILAPGSLEEAYQMGQIAFDLADKYQVPVFILTDQYFVDSIYNLPALTNMLIFPRPHFVKTEKDYLRYRVTPDGLSPRGLPGFGEGFVCADSDEHDEEGRITESETVRASMAGKRMRKMKLLLREAVPPELMGGSGYTALVVGWGSTKGIISEAVKLAGIKGMAQLHFTQVYPLHPGAAELLKKADTIVCVEGNQTGQLADLIKLSTGLDIKHRILKYNGTQFYPEELAEELVKTAGGRARS